MEYIFKNTQSPGDIVMLTAAVRDLKLSHPEVEINVDTSAPELWENNPHLTKGLKAPVMKVDYPLIHESNEGQHHFIHAFRLYLERELQLSIKPTAFKGDIHLSDEEKKWMSQIEEMGITHRFWIINAGGKYDFTAKWWSPISYQKVINKFKGKITFVQVGQKGHWHPKLKGVVDLIGKTDLRQLIRLVYHSSGVITGVSLLMHLAAAIESKHGLLNRPAVIVAGGREPVQWEAYPHHRYLAVNGALSCCDNGGCWKSRCQLVGDGDKKDTEELCENPVDLMTKPPIRIPKCMDMIKADDVIKAIQSYYTGGVLQYNQYQPIAKPIPPSESASAEPVEEEILPVQYELDTEAEFKAAFEPDIAGVIPNIVDEDVPPTPECKPEPPDTKLEQDNEGSTVLPQSVDGVVSLPVKAEIHKLIAIFSKFDMAGGSERRCVELANGIRKYTDHDVSILAEKDFPAVLTSLVHDGVTVVTDAIATPSYFTQAECVIVVNTDCQEFSTLDYWQGKSHRHNKVIPVEGIKKMLFLYNFLISPSQDLHEIAARTDVGIITTNKKFFDEINKQDRYSKVRALPRYTLGSPIDPKTIHTKVRTEAKVFGCHSKRLGSKWNPDWPKLEKKITYRYSTAEFRFMGMKDAIAKGMKGVCLKENESPVSDFLDSLDVFVFFPEYKREEPWARVIAEAMVAGLPIVALDRGGTCDQVLKFNNGLLCKKFDDYHKALVYLIEHPEVIETMSRNSIRISNEFHTERVIKKLMGMV